MEPNPLRVISADQSELTPVLIQKRPETKLGVSLKAAKIKYSVGQSKKSRLVASSSIGKSKTSSNHQDGSPPLRELVSVGPNESSHIMPWDIQANTRPSTSDISAIMLNDVANQSLKTRLIDQIQRKRHSSNGETVAADQESSRPTAAGTTDKSKRRSLSGTEDSKLNAHSGGGRTTVSPWTPFSSALKQTVQNQAQRTLLSVCSVLSLSKDGLAKLEAQYESKRSQVLKLREETFKQMGSDFDRILEGLSQQQSEHQVILESITSQGREARQRLLNLLTSLEVETGFHQEPSSGITNLFDKLQTCKSEVSEISTWAYRANDLTIRGLHRTCDPTPDHASSRLQELRSHIIEMLGMEFKEEPACMIACGLTPTKNALT